VLIVAGLSLVALAVIPPAALDNAIDWLFIATLPVLALLEALLLIALFRLFRDRRMLASLMVAAGGASIVAGLGAAFLAVTAQPALEATATAIGALLTAAELVLMAALVYRASATPPRLWVWGVAAGIGTAAAAGVTPTTSDSLLVVAGILAFAFPVFLFRLGQLSLPTLGGPAR
jgi:hypothetical protein